MSLPSVGVILLLAASCFVWAPRCRKLWKLALLTLMTVAFVFTLFSVLSYVVVLLLDTLELLDLGYMGMGLLVFPPLVASVLSIVGALCALIWARRKGDAWFR